MRKERKKERVLDVILLSDFYLFFPSFQFDQKKVSDEPPCLPEDREKVCFTHTAQTGGASSRMTVAHR